MTSVCALVPAALGVAVLVRRPDGAFRLEGPMPADVEGFLPDAAVLRPAETSAFLGWFLDRAAPVWEGRAEGPLASGVFTEAGANGARRALEATALRVDDQAVLLLGPPQTPYEEVQRVLQAARDLALVAERERRAALEREVLLHCIVHDLSNPLSGISGGLQLLARRDLEADDAELVEVASRNVDRIRAMIRSILHAFEAEVAAMLPAATPDTADVGAVLSAAARAIGPMATMAGVDIAAEPPPGPLPVVAESGRLERVVLNLLDNAVRHTPADGAVRLRAEPVAGAVRIVVEDDGPGVPPDAVPHLFQRFGQRGGMKGRIGLGLYFCKVAAEAWGGAVGHEPAAGGGARFWVRLPRAGVG